MKLNRQTFSDLVTGRSLLVAAGSFAPLLALAQEADPDAFETVVADIQGKVGGYAAALVGVAAVSVGFLVAVKYVKKIRGAA